MRPTCRSLGRALSCREAAGQSPRVLGARLFSKSSRLRKNGPLAVFQPTSSPELDALLETFRSKLFTTSHLLKRHRALVFQGRHHAILHTEPLDVTIGGGDETVRLHPLDQTKDIPSVSKGFAQLLNLMQQPQDWDNLPAFLEELSLAKRTLKPPQLEKMARRANEAGRQDVVLECARRVRRTGFALQDLRVVREVFWGAHLRAMKADWDARALHKALAQAEHLVELLEDPRHAVLGRQAGGPDPWVQPEIVGVLLELAAVRAAKHQDGRDEDGKVLKYAERLRETWSNREISADVGGVTEGKEAAKERQRASYQLQLWLPVWKGLDVATTIISETAQQKWMTDAKAKLLDLVERSRATATSPGETDTPLRGLQWYNHLL